MLNKLVCSTLTVSLYLTDWEYGEGEVEEAESDSDDNTGDPRQLPESEYDFYRLSNLDFEMMTRKSPIFIWAMNHIHYKFFLKPPQAID